MTHFLNNYRHDDCPEDPDGVEWADVWSCACNDRCPQCGAEVEPYKYTEFEIHNPKETTWPT